MQQLQLVSYTEGEVAGAGWALYSEVAEVSYEGAGPAGAGRAGAGACCSVTLSADLPPSRLIP